MILVYMPGRLISLTRLEGGRPSGLRLLKSIYAKPSSVAVYCCRIKEVLYGSHEMEGERGEHRRPIPDLVVSRPRC
jgi:hypothetical protein